MSLKNTNQKGFTIVELLIVIVVIAILAAISIVAFTGVQQRGRDSQRASDASNIVKALSVLVADGDSWPANHTAATALLKNTNKISNVSATTADSLVNAGPAESNAIQFRYQLLCGPSPSFTPSGAQITYWKEQTGAPVSITAGAGTTTCA